MNEIKFKLQTITPMFLGGADVKTAELRPPSFKGMMRFWWRAMKGLGNIQQLREQENKIFGGGGEEANKSCFSIKIICDNIRPSTTTFPDQLVHKVPVSGKSFSINILEYLAYGTYEREKGRNIFIRQYIPSETQFTIVFLIKEEEFIKDILTCFYLLSAFGGLGSRSRNGFGSFHVLNREVFKELGEEYKKNVIPTEEMLNSFMKSNNITGYSCFAEGTKLFKSKNNFNTWHEALAHVGKIYKKCREELKEHHQYDKRQYIGAPLDPPRGTFKSILDRHSKPYFLKVVKENGKYRAYILYLPSKYCDGLDKDRMGNKINHAQVNERFESVCNEFNKFLESKMEVLL